MTQTPIAAVLNLGSSYSRQVLRGIRQYAQTNDWLLYPLAYHPDLRKVLKQLKPCGIITYSFTAGIADAVRNIGSPVVNVSRADPDLPFPRVIVEELRIGEMAAEHLKECGLVHFGYFGSPLRGPDTTREEGFLQSLGANARSVSSYHTEHNQFDPSGSMAISMENILGWINTLPKPAGVFAANDIWALMLSDICRVAGVHVPEDIAIIGVDNDELLCDMARPSLSSVAIPAQRVGYEAAALLDKLMAAKTEAPSGAIFLEPLGVVARQSTDTLAVDDPDLAAAVRFIRENAYAEEPISVADIANSVAISRRSLERRFRALLGHSPTEEVQRLRLRRAMSLLEGTKLKMPQVARRSGFTSAKHLSTVFHLATGITPSEYRRRRGPSEGDVQLQPQTPPSRVRRRKPELR